MHLTVRTAWHDSGWDGKICKDPEGNVYCSGAHSLLSGRIEKNKNVALESSKGVAGELIAKTSSDHDGYVPPCYWSANIQSSNAFDVSQGHAFSSVKARIASTVKPYSFLTWPFRLSFVHDQKNQKMHGNYWPNLEDRIKRYFAKFEAGQSIVFFYANYDNPVSGDDMQYLVTGCSVVKSVDKFTRFDIDEETINGIKNKRNKKTRKYEPNQKMKNFPTMNWAVQLTHDHKKSVFLPYQQYIDYEGEDDSLLSQIKVTVDNPSINNSFKYVSMDMDDDKCLCLLYQMRKSIELVSEHGIVKNGYDADEEIKKINALIEMTWKKRGSYPSFSKVLDYFLEDTEEANSISEVILKKAVSENKCISEILKNIFDDGFDLLGDEYEDALEELSDSKFKLKIKACSILSLLNLSDNQIFNICEDNDLLKEVESNPYVLFERYTPVDDDLDEENITDEVIDFYRIDIAMLPDRKYLKKVPLQKNFKESSPVRLRALVRDCLLRRGEAGDTYTSSGDAERDILKVALLGKDESRIAAGTIESLSDELKQCFTPVVTVVTDNNQQFFYLNYLYKAEQDVASTIEKLVGRKPHKNQAVDIEAHIKESLEKLKDVIKTKEDREFFSKERKNLLTNVFQQSFFLLTGKPGAGKTYETSKIIEHLHAAGEGVTVLAPTGKASLRIKQNIKQHTKLEDNAVSVETIDRFIYTNGGRELIEDPEFFDGPITSVPIDNLVIDESSMIDLLKLHVLFRLIKVDDNRPKRIIMVGDENQLPPIGAGRPFYDLITHFLSDEKLAARHYVCLQSNCRQKGDPEILNLAGAFSDGSRYYNKSLDLFDHEGKQSEGIWVHHWQGVAELNQKIDAAMNEVFKLEKLNPEDAENKKFAFLNKLFGLYKEGYLPGIDSSKLAIDQWQILTPYRPAGYGTMGLNKYIQTNYREPNRNSYKEDSFFVNADKVIRLNNWYSGFQENRTLKLSNGSMGLYNYSRKGETWRFPDLDQQLYSVDSNDNFDLAYAITVHKSQGSDFETIFLVIPEKKALLSRELLYTALTRSRTRLFVFLQKSEGDPINYALHRSDTAQRNSSLLTPVAFDKVLIPEGVSYSVRSRIEFIIHNALTKNGLKPRYEKPLEFKIRGITIKCESFTIRLPSGKMIYWEHLGMLDKRKYYIDWQRKKQSYHEEGLADQLVTTDDIGGISDVKIQKLIDDLINESLQKTPDSEFSTHHYKLY